MKSNPKKEENNALEEEGLSSETEDVLKKIQEQLTLSEEALNKTSYKRSMSLANPNINLNQNQNIVKIKDSSLEFVNIEDDFKNKPKDSPFDDICSICSSNIYLEKYLCLICKECILCPNCESNHLHPVIKWKNNQLSSLNKIFLFLSNYNKEIKNIIRREGSTITKINVESGEFCKMYHFDVGLFSTENNIELDFNFISFKVKVSNE